MKNTWTAALRPTLLSGIFCLYLFLLQSFVFADGWRSPSEGQWAFGAGSALVIELTQLGDYRVHLSYLPLVGSIASCYVLAIAADRVVTWWPGRRRPERILLATIGTLLILSFVTSVLFSRYYWGYFFMRPTLTTDDVPFKTVRGAGTVATVQDGEGRPRLQFRETLTLEEVKTRCLRDRYYCLDGRILMLLDSDRKLPTHPRPPSAELVRQLYARLEATGLIVEGASGAKYAKHLSGVVVEGDDGSGRRLVFVGVSSGELDNDHYAYYEVLFEWPEGANTPTSVLTRRFFYDIAGMEGMEWPFVFAVVFLLGVALAVPSVGVLIVSVRAWRAVRARS